MDLRFEYGSAGCRRLWALVVGLPIDAAVRRNGKVWTTREELAARQIEQEAGLLRLIAEQLGAKFKGPPPEPIKHPDRVTEDPRRMSTVQEIKSFINRLHRR